MASILYKWFLPAILLAFNVQNNGSDAYPSVVNDHAATALRHPYFLSVTQIEHNAKDKILEISCKLFTDDFEKTLRQHYKADIDLINPKDKIATDKIVAEYIQQHLVITADNKNLHMDFIGYEKEEEGIISYFQVNNIASVKKMSVTNNLLYEYKKEQMGIIHVIVGGDRKSSKLTNPDDKLYFEF